MIANDVLKACPACKSDVHAEAQVCRYCRHRFGPGGRPILIGSAIAVVVVAVAVGVAPRSSRQITTPSSSDTTQAASATERPTSADAKVEALLLRQAQLNEACRGGDVTADSQVCKERDNVDGRLSKAGWCYGEPGESEVDEDWHECVALEKDPIDERHRKWIDDCQDAVRDDLNDPGSADFPNPISEPRAFAQMQVADTEKGPNPERATPATLDAWTAKHPELFSEDITFKFRAKNIMGGVQRYTATCTFLDNFDGTTKLVSHAAGAD